MEPIRVLQVVGRMDRGGIETLIMNLYRNIDRSKIQFDFLTHYGKESDYNEEIRSLGGKIYEMPAIKTTKKANYHKVFHYIYALNKFFKNHPEFKVVHGHMTNTASIYMPIAKRHGVTTCIAHSHLTRATKGINGKVTDILQLPLKKIATDYFSCSKMAAEWMFSESIINSGNVKVLNNAIDTSQYDYDIQKRSSYRKEMNLEGKFVVGHVGRFFHQKNHDFLIEIFYEILKKNKEAVLLLIGEGKLKKEMEKKVEYLGIKNNVKFLGLRNDIPNLMQVLDVFVMPSHFEGLPLVGIESQSAGLKCFMSEGITRETDVTGNVEFLPLSMGAERWAAEIVKYAKGYDRRSTKQDIINAGYDIKATSNWMQNFYLNKHNN